MVTQTKMATETEVVGEPTVSVPESMEAELEQFAKDEASQDEKQNLASDNETEEVKEEDTSHSEDVHLSERHEKRAGQLISKLKSQTERAERAEKEASALRQSLESLKTQTPSSLPDTNFGAVTPPWDQPRPMVGQEITREEYQRHVLSTADNIVKARVGQFVSEFARVNQFESDLRTVENKYPMFNQDSPKFNAEKTKEFVEKYVKMREKDPSMRLLDFADTVMSFHQAGQTEGQAGATNRIAQQMGSEAVSPSSPTKLSKETSNPSDPSDMSDEDMEQYLRESGEWDKA